MLSHSICYLEDKEFTKRLFVKRQMISRAIAHKWVAWEDWRMICGFVISASRLAIRKEA